MVENYTGKVGKLYETIKAQPNVHFIDKTRYDWLLSTPLDSLLRERSINQVEIVGVCTDICVLGYQQFLHTT